ncbi:MAG: DegT/DnrJ/EryC1/StrS family aminotransferase [Kangiellaceae bacterium]|nr:DegT/DnrJ/EryC1/StrS family aminotransferase [Kangiellaceae bacterium]MCW8997651.1 DegT/DnrJ/EryC1/StrS family aminotransferase [Kangiellaceae bacterium]MCW9018094.1 DegT/DnrJ/EryC1/StrS family aminotransferase [Kangiellaceae bacterium]
MKNTGYIVYGKPDIKQAEIEEVVDSMKNAWLGSGPKVHQFEQNFAEYKNIDSSMVAAVNSCTAALHLALIASGIGPGDEVITTGMTFCATVNAIIHSGATPVIADIDATSYNICPLNIQKKITAKTKAIVVVHFAGNACDMNQIMKISNNHCLKVIEDCAHAVESEYQGKKLGTIGDFGCFSFYVTKNMTTGEGGMVVAKNKDDIDKIKMLALHGISKDAWKRFSDDGYKHYQVVFPGYKYNMMDIQAAIGIHQLKRIDQNHIVRAAQFQRYLEMLKDLPIKHPPSPSKGDKASYHLYPILVKDNYGINRDQLIQKLHLLGIGVGVHYLSIMSHDYYQKNLPTENKTPVADKFGQQTLSLPLSSALTETEQSRVINALRKIYNEVD